MDFWAPWCAPCRQLTPLLENAVGRHADEVVLAKVNIDENPMLAQHYRVMSIPLVKVFRDGEVVDEFTGLQSAHTIDAFINRLVPTKADRLVEIGDELSLREALELDPANTRRPAGPGAHADRRRARRTRSPRCWPRSPTTARRPASSPASRWPMSTTRTSRPAWPRGTRASRAGARTPARRRARAPPTTERRDVLRAAIVGMFGELGEHHPLTARFRKRLAQALY